MLRKFEFNELGISSYCSLLKNQGFKREFFPLSYFWKLILFSINLTRSRYELNF